MLEVGLVQWCMNWEKNTDVTEDIFAVMGSRRQLKSWKDYASSTISDIGAGAIFGFHFRFHQNANFPHFTFCLCGLFYKITHIVFWFCIRWACAGRESTRDHNWHCSAGRGAIVERLPLTHGDKRWIYQLSWWTALIWAIISCSIWINTANHPNFNSEEEIGAARINCMSMYIAQYMFYSVAVYIK